MAEDQVLTIPECMVRERRVELAKVWFLFRMEPTRGWHDSPATEKGVPKWGSWPKSATEVEGFWIQQVGGAAAGVNPRSI